MATRRGTYDQVKEFQGQRYTGMKVGRRHRWKYDAGDWSEKKVTPDRWEFEYKVPKRRAGRAPEGSGAPVGTAYHWYILADQVVTKVDANTYTTEMVGHKFKVAHKRADKTTWSASDAARRRRLVKLLRDMAAELERAQVLAAPEPVEVKAAAKATKARRKAARRGGAGAPRRSRAGAA